MPPRERSSALVSRNIAHFVVSGLCEAETEGDSGRTTSFLKPSDRLSRRKLRGHFLSRRSDFLSNLCHVDASEKRNKEPTTDAQTREVSTLVCEVCHVGGDI
ncbi:hypothetical protein JOB18_007199 [Solea senegalensis]|uniref:Uncharacterized protein n=1 Tax=Solea senegalensis TaxID=28829 RepID=A0AAV6RHA5_SOLSE|nr:hypothetical protein JOB18_007199 [Solea senegalensis]